MVATVGSISIDLSTNAVKFADGFKRSATTVERESNRMSKAVGGFGKAMKGMGGLMQGFVGGIAGGLAVGALGSLSGALGKASAALHEFEDIGNRAKSAGISAEFFQTLQFAAHKTDVETETLNTSLQIFTKNVGLAREGTGGLYSGLLKLNPELLRAVLTAGNQEQRLRLVAEAMRQTSDEAQRAALATAVFGKGGADMVRMLGEGATALDRFKQEAKDLGLIVTDADLRRYAEAAGRVDDLAYTLDKKLKIALANSAPLIEAGITDLEGFTGEVNELITAINAFVANPNLETFNKFFFGKGGEEGIDLGSIAVKTFKEWVAGAETAAEEQARLNEEIRAAHENLTRLFKLAEQGVDVDIGIIEAMQRLNTLQTKAVEVTNTIAQMGATAAEMARHQQFRASEIASMAAISGGGPTLPTVHYGNRPVQAEIDPDVMDDVERAIAEETAATKKAPYITGRYVDEFHRDTATYFDGLSNTVSSGFSGLSGDVQGLSASIVRMAEAGLGYTADKGFKFSGIGGSGSWAGRQFTSSGTAQSFADIYARPVQSPTMDASTVTEASGAVSVNIVVKPILEGTRLSAQSAAEIKQSAAAGTNAALRQYYGR